jgi:hypothetical protein
MYTILSVFLIQMQDCLRVTICRVAMAPLLQGGPEFPMVIDFAVEYDP